MLGRNSEILRSRDGTLYSMGSRAQAVDVASEELTWETKLEDLSTTVRSAAIAEETIYVGGNTTILALERGSGSVRWAFDVDKPTDDRASVDTLSATGKRAFAGVSWGDGRITESKFVSLDATDGTQRFQQRFDGGDVIATTATHGSLVYLGVLNQSLAYDPARQEVFSTEDRFGIDVGGNMNVDGDRMLLRESGLRVHDLVEKSNIFEVETMALSDAAPVMVNDTVVSGGDGGIHAHSYPSGTQEWHVRTTDDVVTPIATYESIAFTGDESGVLYGVDISSGRLLYDEKPLGPDRWTDPMIVLGDTLLIGGGNEVEAYEIQVE
jgi:outer membrane protein assembly factor BamB